jgi:hypothetical protein
MLTADWVNYWDRFGENLWLDFRDTLGASFGA